MFGTSVVVARLGMAHAHPRAGAWMTIASTTTFYWLTFPFYPSEFPATPADWQDGVLPGFIGLFVLLGMFTPGISLLLSFEGNRRLGPTISGTVASTSPLVAAAAAVALLGERVTLPLALGTLAVVSGVMALSWQGKAQRDWRYWTLLFPLGAAFIRGVVSMAARYGMNLAPAPFAAALIAATMAVVTLPLIIRISGLSLPFDGARRGLPWFMLSGVLNGVATLCLYTALLHGTVVTVAPVAATFPVFTFLLSLALRMDRLRVSMVLGVVLVVTGVVGIVAG